MGSQDVFLGKDDSPWQMMLSDEELPEPRTMQLPTVLAHGMGDSCFNSGFKSLTEFVGQQTQQYSVCIPTGNNKASDTANGFFMTMDKSVDVFAEKIKNDTKLANGFHCLGLSQGNSLCRGYIQKYNDPPVSTFLSIHGTVSGVAGFPNCNPDGLLGPVCASLAKLLGVAAYTSLAQNALFQADYYRDPSRVGKDAYKKGSQIAQWNNEGEIVDSTINANFAKTKRFVMIKAEKDSMVYPNEGEWWGHFEDGAFKKVLSMKDTDWYQKDLFGLRTADEAGKIFFNSTTGDHLQFSDAQVAAWIDQYYLD